MYRQQNSSNYPTLFFLSSSEEVLIGATGISVICSISKNGGTFAAPVGSVFEIGKGWYGLAGNATDRNTLGELIINVSGTGALSTDIKQLITPISPFDSIYICDINFTRDQSNTQDEYTFNWLKDGAYIGTGVTNCAYSVIKRSDGTNLISNAVPTDLGNNIFKSDQTGASRITLGEAFIVIVSGDINGNNRTWRKLLGRDS